MNSKMPLQRLYDYDEGNALSAWRVQFRPVPDRLHRLVDSIMSYPDRGDGKTFSRVPEGIAHIVCLLTPAAGQSTRAGSIRTAALLVSGPHTTKHPMVIAGETMVAQLRPGAVRMILGLAGAELKNRVVPAEAVWGSSASELLDRIVCAPSVSARLDAFTAFLVARLRHPAVDDLFAVTAAAWMQGRGGCSCLADLAARSGYSDRQTRRKFTESLGLSPKAFARTLRLRSVLALGSRGADWAHVASATGYYDQSHLVHEFKRAFGLPPSAFFDRAPLSSLSRFGILEES
jgi:AraC-like DNA-binding protein